MEKSGSHILWVSLLLMTLPTAVASINALRGREDTCGDVPIPYAFGISPVCWMEGFSLNFTATDSTYRPFHKNRVEVLSISRLLGQARMNSEVEEGNDWFNRTTGSINNDREDRPPLKGGVPHSFGIGGRPTFDANNTDIFKYFGNKDHDRQVVVIRNGTCETAKLDMATYGCVSDNSECVDLLNGSRYFCRCSEGYQGNPYLVGGCQDDRANKDIVSLSRDKKLPLVIGISSSVILFILVVFCVYTVSVRRKLIQLKAKYFQQHGGWLLYEEMRSKQRLTFKIFTREELEEATNNFDDNTILGHGGYGTVYKGTLKDTRVVAIKRSKVINESQRMEFGKEMIILSQINHKNVVKLLGCCLEVEVPMLVYEFVPNGTLFQLIHGKNNTSHVSLQTRLRIAHESAEALAYLHSSASPPIIHGDVKPSNILLDRNYMAKVSDFGNSMLAPIDLGNSVPLVQGTYGYLDPEYLQTSMLTYKSDVYSFGVILLELLTSKKALNFEAPKKVRSLSSDFTYAMKAGRLHELLNDQILNEEEMGLIEEVAKLAMACISIRGEERPTMKEVAEELGRLRKLNHHSWVCDNNLEEMGSLFEESSNYHETQITLYYSLDIES